MWKKIKNSISGKNDGIYYFALGNMYMKIRVEPFKHDKLSINNAVFYVESIYCNDEYSY